jgi:sulfoxide reductase catalytic subunit YedY
MVKQIKPPKIRSFEITPEAYYLSRRRFIKTAIAGTAGAALLAACRASSLPDTLAPSELPAGTIAHPGNGLTDELGAPLTPEADVTHYNNYYEFSMNKKEVANIAKDFITSPWQVEVGGLVRNPKTYDMSDLLTGFSSEERIYRMRCVEGWAMVIPWQGFQLSRILDDVEPMTSARYVHFVTLLDPKQMPGQLSNFFPWPYEEGLRLDEAQHQLTLMATGLYGKALEPQNGGPIRLVVPWKYGYKSIKSIVRIELVENQPRTTWNEISPEDYGFYSNVNPEIDYPRFNQTSETRIGENKRVATQKFNGYESKVGALYNGMDLRVDF